MRDMVQKEIVELMKDNGITPDKVIKNYQETYNAARNEGHTGTMKSVNDQFAKMLGMDGRTINPAGELPAGGVDDGELAGLLGSNGTAAVDNSEFLNEDDYMEVE